MHETYDGFMTVWGGGGWNSPHNNNNNNNTVVDAADCCSAACGVSLGGVQGLLTAAGPWFISPIILVPQRGASPRVTLQGAATCTVQYSHLLLMQYSTVYASPCRQRAATCYCCSQCCGLLLKKCGY